MTALIDLKSFNVDDSEVSLWVFKGPSGPANDPPQYTARWVSISNEVRAALKDIVLSQRDSIEEVLEYDLLAQNNEGSVLTIGSAETHAVNVIDATAEEIEGKKVRTNAQLWNNKFYVIKLTHAESCLRAIRMTGKDWRLKRGASARSFIFQDSQLNVDDRPQFRVNDGVDFFLIDQHVLIKTKKVFESVLRYKQAHINDFGELSKEADFLSIFDDLTPLNEHVGSNKIQLRRMSAVRQKGHYKDPNFMKNLRDQAKEFGFNIRFSDDGKIVIDQDTCAEVITALLDHRLRSAFSKQIYDVPSTTQVAL